MSERLDIILKLRLISFPQFRYNLSNIIRQVKLLRFPCLLFFNSNYCSETWMLSYPTKNRAPLQVENIRNPSPVLIPSSKRTNSFSFPSFLINFFILSIFLTSLIGSTKFILYPLDYLVSFYTRCGI